MSGGEHAGGRTKRTAKQELRGSNLKLSHVHNQRVVLETVRLRGPLSRAEISALTALTAQTISNIVDQLLDRGVMRTIGRRSGMRGQPAIDVDINPDGGYSAGIHLDRDLLTVVLLDLSGACLQSVHRPWSFPSPDEAVPLIYDAAATLCRRQGIQIEQLWGAGVALPGPVDFETGTPIDPPNFPGWDRFPLREILAQRLGVPVSLETDATAAAEGERWFGLGKDLHDYFYIYFGVGLGGGMIVNGQPYRGAFGNAGMFGHIPVDPASGRCPCGGIGCLELTASLSSLYAALGRLSMTTAEIDTLYNHRDPRLMRWLERAAANLTTAMVMLEHLMSPQAVIFGGPFPACLQTWLIDQVETGLPHRRMAALTRHPRLLQSSTLDSAAALGAGTLPLFREFTPGANLI